MLASAVVERSRRLMRRRARTRPSEFRRRSRVMHCSQLRWSSAALLITLLTRVAPLSAQAGGGTGATVTGHVTNVAGQPLPGVTVSITGMGVGSISRDDGLYTFTVPAARATGQTVTLNARRVGYSPQNATITLNAGTI